jgi:hypothetical protein
MNKSTITGGSAGPGGQASHRLTRDMGDLVVSAPRGWTLRNWLRHRRRDVPRQAAMALLGRLPGVMTVQPSLAGAVYRRPAAMHVDELQKLRRLLDGNANVRDLARHFGGQVTDYGTLSTRVVTDLGVAFLVDALENLVEPELLKFHGYGTGTTAEAASQTALVTELTTQYNPDSTRPTGSQTEAAANIYRTVATLSPDAGGTIAVTEHGLFSASSAGVMFDRSVFTAVNLVAASDSLQTTYDLTIASGG